MPIKKNVKSSRKTSKKSASTSMKSARLSSVVIKTPFKKSHLISELVTQTGLSKKEVISVFDGLVNIIERHLKKGGAGEFTFPGLLKCMIKRKPATKARKGINPFTGEATTFKAKPARNIVKVRPLKKMKSMAE